VTEAYSPLGLGEDLRNSVVADIARRIGRTPAQIVLRWHLQAGRVVIPKTVTPARMAENFAITDFELSAEDMAVIYGLHTGNLLGWDPEDVN
jgi:2,5-diketo-D-gluconate reductase A